MRKDSRGHQSHQSCPTEGQDFDNLPALSILQVGEKILSCSQHQYVHNIFSRRTKDLLFSHTKSLGALSLHYSYWPQLNIIGCAYDEFADFSITRWPVDPFTNSCYICLTNARHQAASSSINRYILENPIRNQMNENADLSLKAKERESWQD
jgi:hypothetical protein